MFSRPASFFVARPSTAALIGTLAFAPLSFAQDEITITDANWGASFDFFEGTAGGGGYGEDGPFFPGDDIPGDFPVPVEFLEDQPFNGIESAAGPAGFFEWNDWTNFGLRLVTETDEELGFDAASQLASQSWHFRTDTADFFDGREFNVGQLGYNGTLPSGSDALARFSFGDHDAGLGLELSYRLDGAAGGDPLRSTMTSTATFTNSSDAALNLSVFAYTDLDLDDEVSGQLSRLFGPGVIRHTSQAGSRVDISAGGLAPTAFSNAEFDDIGTRLRDGSITDLSNTLSSGVADATNAFQWDLTLAAGAQIDLSLDYQGVFVGDDILVFPDEVIDNGDGTTTFLFDDGTPPVTGSEPRFYDPEVAIGYEYAITGGDNAFSELFLSAFFPDEDGYFLEILDDSHDLFGQVLSIGSGSDGRIFDFTAFDTDGDGADAFRITGIDPALMLDPSDELAFPTGLTFISDSAVSFSQTSIVPEPVSAALLALPGLALLRRRAGGRA